MMLRTQELRQNQDVSIEIGSSNPLKNGLKSVSQDVAETLSSNDLWRVFDNAHVFDLLRCQSGQFWVFLNLIADLALQVAIAWLSPRESRSLKFSDVILLFVLAVLRR